MGAPLWSTTTTFLHTAQTASISSFWQSGMRMCARSKPSDSKASGRPANTTATSDSRASFTASSRSAASVSPLSVR